MFESEVFRKQMYCHEENNCDIIGTFRRPRQWFGDREIVPTDCATSLMRQLLHMRTAEMKRTKRNI